MTSKKDYVSTEKRLEIIIQTPVNPTEDLKKIHFTLKNIFPDSEPLPEFSNIYIRDNNIEILKKIKEQIKSRRTLSVLERILYSNYNLNISSFLLNKQAAFSGVVAIIDNDDESPLGPIKITIKNCDIENIIRWFEK